MKFVAIRELRSNTAQLRKDLRNENEVILTANGKPFAVMTPVGADNLEEEVRAIRRARAQVALARIQAGARARGLDRLTMDQIDEIVSKARRRRRGIR